MDTPINNKNELLRAIQKPNIRFVDELPASSEKDLRDALKDIQRLVRTGRKLSLVVLESRN